MNMAPRLQLPHTKQGAHGKAWRIDFARWQEPVRAAICGWIVEAPHAHPIWHSYFLTAVHLRPMDGCQPAHIFLPGATHEIMVIALDPSHTPRLDRSSAYLTPMNFTGQWIAECDEAALAKVEASVDEILAGMLNPDTDGIRQWVERYSASNLKVPVALADKTIIAHQGDCVTVIGTGKTAVDAITQIAAGPMPPRQEQH